MNRPAAMSHDARWRTRLRRSVQGLACLVGVLASVGAALGQGQGQGQAQRAAAPPAQPARSNGNTAALTPTQNGLLIGFEGNVAASRSAGQKISNGGAGGAAAAPCASCHGALGQGNPSGGFPRLAGLPAQYIAKQLANYAEGSRPNQVMTPIASQLTPAQRRDLAVYFALQQAPLAAGDVNRNLARQGAQLAEVGNAERGVQACANCHGPNGSGVSPDVPRLAGQSAAYIEAQLTAWQAGQRKNDPLAVMRDVATRLTPDERRAVANYYAGEDGDTTLARR